MKIEKVAFSIQVESMQRVEEVLHTAFRTELDPTSPRKYIQHSFIYELI